MCGLCGYITRSDAHLSRKKRIKRARIFTALLVSMQERGGHSTGIACLDQGKIDLVKAVMPASRFTRMQKYRKALRLDSSMVIGHTRFATMGDITQRNAHPFRRGNIIGAHNGMVFNHLNFKDKYYYEVDSEIIFDLLDTTKNDFKQSFSQLYGQFAITWADVSEDNYKIYMVANGNPLHVAYVKELKTVFWASTFLALKTVLAAHYVNNDQVRYVADNDSVLSIDHQLVFKLTNGVKFKDYYEDRTETNLGSVPFDHSVTTPAPYLCPDCGHYGKFCICDEEDDEFLANLSCDNCASLLDEFAYWDDEGLVMMCEACQGMGGIAMERMRTEDLMMKLVDMQREARN